MRLARRVTPEEISAKETEIMASFDTPDPGSGSTHTKLTAADLDNAARMAVALDQFVALHALDGLAYYAKGEPGSEHGRVATNLIVGNSLLIASGFPMCGESDLKTCIAC